MAASSFHSFLSSSSSSSSSSLSSSSSSSSSSDVKRFHVFPSFHGPDVRRGFLSHLHNLFARKEITIFKDQEIERGRTIGPELVKAIREARASIVVLSKKYASSSWCLDELVEILKCKEALGQIVMPVFYEVDPSDVRKQKGDFGIAFEKSCEGKTGKQKRRWSKALADVATIAGEHSHNWTDEAAMLEKLSTDVSNKLKEEFLKGEFKSFDIDKNGFITAAELRYGLTKDGDKVTDEQVSYMLRGADVNGDGRISYDEFVKFMAMTEAAMKVTDLEEQMKAEFRAFDVDQNGFVSAAELQHVFTAIFGEKPTDEQVSIIIRAGDVDGDGQLSYDELVKLFTKAAEERDMFLKFATDVTLSKEEEEEMREKFMAYDVDKNGFIDEAEFQYVFTRNGTKLTNENIRNFIQTIDVDGDGWISYDEYVKFVMAKRAEKEAAMSAEKCAEKKAAEVGEMINKFATDVTLSKEEDEEMREKFMSYDVDKDGFINEAEFQHVLTRIDNTLSYEGIRQFVQSIRQFVQSIDGQISYDEYVKFLMARRAEEEAAMSAEKFATDVLKELSKFTEFMEKTLF